MRDSFEPGTRWSTRTPIRRPGPGAKSRIAAERSSTPSSISTTTPSMRRSCPQTFSTSSASWRPSTKIRDPRATRAFASWTATDPLAVREEAWVAAARAARCAPFGAVSSTGLPSRRKPAPRGKARSVPRRSSRWTTCTPPAFSTATTAPTHPVSTSSTTVPWVASTGRDLGRPSRPEDRQSPESTSLPYRSFTRRDGRPGRGATRAGHAGFRGMPRSVVDLALR